MVSCTAAEETMSVPRLFYRFGEPVDIKFRVTAYDRQRVYIASPPDPFHLHPKARCLPSPSSSLHGRNVGIRQMIPEVRGDTSDFLYPRLTQVVGALRMTGRRRKSSPAYFALNGRPSLELSLWVRSELPRSLSV